MKTKNELIKMKITEQELKDLKNIRTYFGAHGRTPFEHNAYAVLGVLYDKFNHKRILLEQAGEYLDQMEKLETEREQMLWNDEIECDLNEQYLKIKEYLISELKEIMIGL